MLPAAICNSNGLIIYCINEFLQEETGATDLKVKLVFYQRRFGFTLHVDQTIAAIPFVNITIALYAVNLDVCISTKIFRS